MKCEQAITKHKKITREKVIESQQAQNLVEELQDALDQDEIEPGRLDSLAKQLTDAEDDKATYEGTYEELVIAKDAAFESLRENRDRMTSIDDQIKEVEAKVLKAENKVTQQEKERRDALRKKNAAIELLNEARAVRITRLEARQTQLEIVDNFVEEASQVCARVPVNEGENEESLQRKHGKLLRDLANAEKRYFKNSFGVALVCSYNDRTGNRGDIARNAYKAVAAMERAQDEVEGVERLAQVGDSVASKFEMDANTCLAAEDDSCQSKRTLEIVPEVDHRSGANSVLLPAQRTRISWPADRKS